MAIVTTAAMVPSFQAAWLARIATTAVRGALAAVKPTRCRPHRPRSCPQLCHYRRRCHRHRPRLTTQWATLAAKYNVSLAAVAVTFASLPAIITKVVLGMASPEEVALNLESMQERVPPELWSEAKQLGLIRPEVPVPK